VERVLSTKPDEAVAALIVEELVKKRLLPPRLDPAFASRLAEGSVTAEDWVRLVERREDAEAGDPRAH
jgi:hypothetical protein